MNNPHVIRNYLNIKKVDTGISADDLLVIDSAGNVKSIARTDLNGDYYTKNQIIDFFNGTTAITGYNKTNWDTAFGWGNHASAGYLTSYTETDTLQSVTDRGNTTSNAINISGNAALSFSTHGGGWYMADSSWIRTVGGKNIYQNIGILRTDGTLQVGSGGGKLNVPATGTPTIDSNTIYHAGNLTNVSQLANDAGYLTTETDSQTLTFTNGDLSISNGNTVDLDSRFLRRIDNDVTTFTAPAQGTRAKILNLSATGICKLTVIGSENGFYQPLELTITRNATGSTCTIIRHNQQVHTHSNDVAFSWDANGDIWLEKIIYSTGRTVTLKNVLQLSGTVQVFNGSVTSVGNGSDQSTTYDDVYLRTNGGNTMTGELKVQRDGRVASFGINSNAPNVAIANQNNYIQIVSNGATESMGVVFHNAAISTSALEYVNTSSSNGYFNLKSDDTTWDARINNNVIYHAGNLTNVSQLANDAGYLTTDNNTTYTSSLGILLTGTNFTPTYGTAANTIAQGNDSRINNGQTAFGWGDHALGGYLPASGGNVTGRINTTSDIRFTGVGVGSGLLFNSTVITNDAAGIRQMGTNNAGELEFFTTDDDVEPFVFRHYTLGQDGSGASVEWFKINGSGAYSLGNLLATQSWVSSKGYVTTDTNTTYTSSNGILLTGTNFTPTYGTAANTIAQGNDSRINNGQTAFGWGDHSVAGYLTAYTETDTLQSVTSRGSTSSILSVFNGGVVGNLHASTTGAPGLGISTAIWTISPTYPDYGIFYQNESIDEIQFKGAGVISTTIGLGTGGGITTTGDLIVGKVGAAVTKVEFDTYGVANPTFSHSGDTTRFRGGFAATANSYLDITLTSGNDALISAGDALTIAPSGNLILQAQSLTMNASAGIGHGTFALNMNGSPSMYVVGSNSNRRTLFSNGLSIAAAAQVEIVNGTSTMPGLIVGGATSQTGNIFEVQNIALTVLAGIDNNGYVTANQFIKSDATADDVLLGDGTTTSLAGISGGSAFDGGAISGTIGRTAHNVGHLEGGYNNIGFNETMTNPIFTIGSSYNPTTTTLVNMYGIGYGHTTASYINATDAGSTGVANGYGLYVAAIGKAKIWLNANDGSGHFKGDLFSNGSIQATQSWVQSLGYMTAGNPTITTGPLTNTGVATKDKLRVWNSSLYTIGMTNAMTSGGLGSDYAMTFQMNNSATRGFWWGADTHTNNQGAASLTTGGKMMIAHSLRIGYGIGDVTTPGAVHALDVSGSISATGDIIAFNSSDRRLKRNIKSIENAIEKVLSISGNTFDWNEDLQNIHKGSDIGVIAQEIEAILPDIVITRSTGYKAVNYEKLIALLIEAAKEQQSQIEDLKQEIHTIKEQ